MDQIEQALAKLNQGARTSFGVDFGDDSVIDENRMMLRIPFADGTRRDGVGDLLEVSGIDTSRHQSNPIVLFDHGKELTVPIGLAEEPQTKAYTVAIDPAARKAVLDAYFYQGNNEHALLCEQLFDLAAKRYIRAGSIGYQVIQAQPLQPDYQKGIPQGLHLQKVLMLEGSLVVMPANQDTVRKALCLNKVCGKPLSPVLVKSLMPYAPARKAQMGYEGRKAAKPGDRMRLRPNLHVVEPELERRTRHDPHTGEPPPTAADLTNELSHPVVYLGRQGDTDVLHHLDEGHRVYGSGENWTDVAPGSGDEEDTGFAGFRLVPEQKAQMGYEGKMALDPTVKVGDRVRVSASPEKNRRLQDLYERGLVDEEVYDPKTRQAARVGHGVVENLYPDDGRGSTVRYRQDGRDEVSYAHGDLDDIVKVPEQKAQMGYEGKMALDPTVKVGDRVRVTDTPKLSEGLGQLHAEGLVGDDVYDPKTRRSVIPARHGEVQGLGRMGSVTEVRYQQEGHPVASVAVSDLHDIVKVPEQKAQMGYAQKAKGDRIDVHDDRVEYHQVDGDVRPYPSDQPMASAERALRYIQDDDAHVYGEGSHNTHRPPASQDLPQLAIGKDGLPYVRDLRTQKSAQPDARPRARAYAEAVSQGAVTGAKGDVIRLTELDPESPVKDALTIAPGHVHSSFYQNQRNAGGGKTPTMVEIAGTERVGDDYTATHLTPSIVSERANVNRRFQHVVEDPSRNVPAHPDMIRELRESGAYDAPRLPKEGLDSKAHRAARLKSLRERYKGCNRTGSKSEQLSVYDDLPDGNVLERDFDAVVPLQSTRDPQASMSDKYGDVPSRSRILSPEQMPGVLGVNESWGDLIATQDNRGQKSPTSPLSVTKIPPPRAEPGWIQQSGCKTIPAGTEVSRRGAPPKARIGIEWDPQSGRARRVYDEASMVLAEDVSDEDWNDPNAIVSVTDSYEPGEPPNQDGDMIRARALTEKGKAPGVKGLARMKALREFWSRRKGIKARQIRVAPLDKLQVHMRQHGQLPLAEGRDYQVVHQEDSDDQHSQSRKPWRYISYHEDPEAAQRQAASDAASYRERYGSAHVHEHFDVPLGGTVPEVESGDGLLPGETDGNRGKALPGEDVEWNEEMEGQGGVDDDPTGVDLESPNRQTSPDGKYRIIARSTGNPQERPTDYDFEVDRSQGAKELDAALEKLKGFIETHGPARARVVLKPADKVQLQNRNAAAPHLYADPHSEANNRGVVFRHEYADGRVREDDAAWVDEGLARRYFEGPQQSPNSAEWVDETQKALDSALASLGVKARPPMTQDEKSGIPYPRNLTDVEIDGEPEEYEAGGEDDLWTDEQWAAMQPDPAEVAETVNRVAAMHRDPDVKAIRMKYRKRAD